MINKAYNDIKKVHYSKESFSDDLSRSQKRLGIPLGGFNTSLEQTSFYFNNGTDGMDRLTDEALKILKKHDLPHSYHYHMSLYLIGDDLCSKFTQDNSGVCEIDPASGIGVENTDISERWINGNLDFRTLYISKHATKESAVKYFSDHWPFVEIPLKRGETTKHKEEKKYERNLRILGLSTFAIDELEEIVGKEDIDVKIQGGNKRERLIKKIISDEFDDDVSTKTIKNIISKMRKSHSK